MGVLWALCAVIALLSTMFSQRAEAEDGDGDDVRAYTTSHADPTGLGDAAASAEFDESTDRVLVLRVSSRESLVVGLDAHNAWVGHSDALAEGELVKQLENAPSGQYQVSAEFTNARFAASASSSAFPTQGSWARVTADVTISSCWQGACTYDTDRVVLLLTSTAGQSEATSVSLRAAVSVPRGEQATIATRAVLTASCETTGRGDCEVSGQARIGGVQIIQVA